MTLQVFSYFNLAKLYIKVQTDLSFYQPIVTTDENSKLMYIHTQMLIFIYSSGIVQS